MRLTQTSSMQYIALSVMFYSPPIFSLFCSSKSLHQYIVGAVRLYNLEPLISKRLICSRELLEFLEKKYFSKLLILRQIYVANVTKYYYHSN